jgi:hypothetical protein
MDKNELEQLATFMGHTEKTHSEFYRLPDDVYQTAKVSKLLLLAKNGSIEQFKGKSLTEININDDIVEGDTLDSEDDYIDINVGDSETVDGQRVTEEPLASQRKITKRTLIAWTQQQKTLTESHFKMHIKKKVPPKKHEVLALIKKHPNVFQNRTWKVIKVYVQKNRIFCVVAICYIFPLDPSC